MTGIRPEVEDRLAGLRKQVRSIAGKMLLTNDVQRFIRDTCILVDDLELTIREGGGGRREEKEGEKKEKEGGNSHVVPERDVPAGGVRRPAPGK